MIFIFCLEAEVSTLPIIFIGTTWPLYFNVTPVNLCICPQLIYKNYFNDCEILDVSQKGLNVKKSASSLET